MINSKSFDFHIIGGPYGDETSLYDVIFHKKLTVKEFIQEVLLRNEWGSITIKYDGDNFVYRAFGYPLCEYKGDKLLSTPPDSYMDKTIMSAKGHGGWSLMNYKLTIDNTEEEQR